MIGATLFAAAIAVTVSVEVPDLVESWAEVAVTVADVLPLTIMGAVSRPDAEICPALVAHVTAELKFPVPMTVAEHWLVWPDCTGEGAHDAATDVIVDVLPPPPLLLPPPPPQAVISTRLPRTSRIPKLRTTLSLLSGYRWLGRLVALAVECRLGRGSCAHARSHTAPGPAYR